MLNVDLMLGGSAFFSNLDDKSKAKFKARLLKRLNRKLGGESAAISLADIVISEENVLEIQKHTRNIVCFSWLGLAFGPFWAIYHRIPASIFTIAALFLVAWPVLLVDHAAYLKFNDALARVGASVGFVFALYGRAWLVTHEVTQYLEIRFPMQKFPAMSGVWLIGNGFRKPWMRVSFLIAATMVFLGVEIGIEILLYG
ncbi:MAG: hypothetical protein ACPH89_09695 [Candidatus Puniceispirillaceae bacterium]